MSLFGRLITCYAVADQEPKPIKHSDQTAYSKIRLRSVKLSLLNGPTMLDRHLFTGHGLSPHSCGSLGGAMFYTQKAGASYMQYAYNKKTHQYKRSTLMVQELLWRTRSGIIPFVRVVPGCLIPGSSHKQRL